MGSLEPTFYLVFGGERIIDGVHMLDYAMKPLIQPTQLRARYVLDLCIGLIQQSPVALGWAAFNLAGRLMEQASLFGLVLAF